MTIEWIFKNPEKRTIIPTEYMGVKLISFGFAGQGRAIMRGPMVSGVIDQLLTTTEWYGLLLLPVCITKYMYITLFIKKTYMYITGSLCFLECYLLI